MKVAAFDIGGTAIKYCLYDSAKGFSTGDVREAPTNAPGGGAALMERVSGLAASLGKADAVAVSTAGQVDPVSGSIIYATDNIPDYTGTKIRKLLKERFHVPVVVENDVNAAALGEAFYGAGAAFPDFLCLTYGTGIGGAIIIDHRIYYGSSCSAGEFGHIITHAGGRKCTCGNSGCYECYASTRALIRMVRKASGIEMDGRALFAAAMGGNKAVKDAVDRWIDEVINGLVSLIHCFNPPCILLGGGIMNEAYVTGEIRARLPARVMPNYRRVEIRKAALGNTAGLRGVIHLAVDPQK